MSWLTNPWLFWLGYPLFVAGQIAFAWMLSRSTGGKSVTNNGKVEESGQNKVATAGLVEIRNRLELLLRRGYDQASVIISFENANAFLQFRKYIHAKGDVGLELNFPQAEWSRDYFPKLSEWCPLNGFTYDIEHDVQGGRLGFLQVDAGEDILHVDTSEDLDKAMRLVEGTITQVFGLKPDTEFTSRYSLVDQLSVDSQMGKTIDDPAATPPSSSEILRLYGERFREKTGHTLQEGCLTGFLSVLGSLGFLGLQYSLIWRIAWQMADVQPAWGFAPLALFEVTLNARAFELSCLALLILSVLSQFTDVSRRIRANRTRNSSEAKKRAWRRSYIRQRYIYLPVVLTVLILFWLR